MRKIRVVKLADKQKLRWGEGMILVAALVFSEIIYILVQKPPEYFHEFITFSEWRFKTSVASGEYTDAWRWLARAVYFQRQLMQTNERLNLLSVSYKLPDYQELPDWMEQGLGEIAWAKEGVGDGKLDLADGLFKLGIKAEQSNNNQEARDFYTTAIALEPLWGTYRVALAALEEKEGNTLKADGIIAKCQEIPEAKGDCDEFKEEQNFLRTISRAHKAYMNGNYVIMDEALTEAFNLIMSGVKRGDQQKQRLGVGFEIDKSILSEADWELLGSVNNSNLAKFSYLLGLAYDGIGSEKAGEWLHNAVVLAPNWSYFALEEINYLLAKDQKSRAALVLKTCITNSLTKDDCLDYQNRFWVKGQMEKLGNYRGDIENEIRE